MKKTTLITLLLSLLFVQSKAQTVTGRIVDSKKQSVVMATIALQTLDSINICATTADADGFRVDSRLHTFAVPPHREQHRL